MKTMFKTLIGALLCLGLSVTSVTAQTYLTNTTTSAAVSTSATTVTVNSTTNITAGAYLYIDHELMLVSAINTTTRVATVNRQLTPGATKLAAHGSGAVVYVITAAQAPTNALPTATATRSGQCSTSTSSSATTALSPTLTGQLYLPIIDVQTGDFYSCRRVTGGLWVWVITNVQGNNAIDGSLPTAWP